MSRKIIATVFTAAALTLSVVGATSTPAPTPTETVAGPFNCCR